MVIITDASEEDLPQIYNIEVESFDNPYPYSLLKAYLYLANGFYLVAKEDGKILGYIIGIIQFKTRGHIVSIAVKKEYRNQGIGNMLINKLEERFLSASCFYSYLEVMVTNYSAIFFYHSNNYLIMFTRKNYYGRGKHAYVMVKYLLNREGLE
ncbi:ribosomal protein S18-alanine N-acetyltransferase [Acidianus manzaensis]|uniref:Ribosomal-protein-alanine N-acetyltransferase n=1 Tax=Acidianus manzaensis TaxID=282676 RepID=A0A1W6JZS2_9CREN|nr:ribosomal protein S18-alanine N-acetyltransferase [Acidianus manzaensis]ARM75766.1 ribosomal-protein-alanine N-acetyltransferase [Acidianus manzaensis]